MEIDDLVGHSVLRRCWFLSKAVECGDFAEALEIARAAEEFVMGPSGEDGDVAGNSKTTVAAPAPAPIPDPPAMNAEREHRPGRLAIAADRRDELLDRLAQGARNRELAALFGLSPKQIQGVRMGAAREIAERRNRRPHPEAAGSGIDATVDDVVCYLRRQDDVVVRQEDGTFLVNGRFRLDAAELVAKANRMLKRQHKPVFKPVGPDCALRTPPAATALGANGHRQS